MVYSPGIEFLMAYSVTRTMLAERDLSVVIDYQKSHEKSDGILFLRTLSDFKELSVMPGTTTLNRPSRQRSSAERRERTRFCELRARGKFDATPPMYIDVEQLTSF